MHKPWQIKCFIFMFSFYRFTKMSRAKDYFRIRFAALMAVGTFLASIGYVISGKRAVQRGESVSRMNLEWQQKNRDEVQAKKREMEKQQ